MRDDLYRLSKVVASSLALNDMLVYLAGGDVVFTRQGDVEVAFVVAQIEIDFAAIVEYKDFPMSVRSQYLVLLYTQDAATYSLGFIVPASTLR